MDNSNCTLQALPSTTGREKNQTLQVTKTINIIFMLNLAFQEVKNDKNR